MRRALVALLAGFALAAVIVAPSGGTVLTVPVGTQVFTSDDLTYSGSPLEELPPGAKAQPDRNLASSDTPALVLLAVVIAALAGSLLLWIATRLLAIEPRWVTGGRHAFAEAGWRASTAWDDFKDWLGPGR